MPTKTELEKLRGEAYTDANLNRVLGIIEAYVKGKKVTLNWVYNQIVKGHNLSDGKRILEIFEEHLTSIDPQRYIEVKERLS